MSALLSAVIISLYKDNKRLRKDRKKLRVDNEEKNKLLMKAIASGVCSLLRERMKSIYQDVINKGYITSAQREVWEKCFKSYITLGGNGIIKDMNEEIRDVKIREA